MTEKAKPLGKSTTTESGKKKVERVRLSCACNRDITLDELTIAYPHRAKVTLEKFLPELNKTMTAYGLTTCIKKVHFLAQIGHESSELQFVEEILKKGVKEADVYDGYKGRGLVQLTWKRNYQAYGEAVGQDFLGDNKVNLQETKWATDSAGWYWRHAGGNHDIDLNDPAEQNDMLFITASINGGFNGYQGNATGRLELLQTSVDGLNIVICPRLEELFAAFPEKTKFTYESYKLSESKAFDKPDMAFAWGYWHDPKSSVHGTDKEKTEAILGYSRYVELVNSNAKIPTSKRFGFTRLGMKEHAEKRVEDLSKA
jgi:predicted chitinase